MREKIVEEWNLDRVKQWIEECLSSGGTPAFRTHGWRGDIVVDGERVVYAICLSAKNKQVPTLVLKTVPKDVVDLMESTVGEWRIFRKMKK